MDNHKRLIVPVSAINSYIINYVLRLRKEQRISQRKLGTLMHVNGSYITSVESPYKRGKYNLDHINALAWYLDMSPRLFLPEEPFDPDL